MYPLFQAVSHLELFYTLDKFGRERLEDRFVDIDAIGTYTGLPHISELGDHGTPHRLVHVGIFEDDERGIPPQL
jgi:hypothetical protein